MSTYANVFKVADDLTDMDQGVTIRWVMHGRFTYLALKVREFWYTTATEENTIVGQRLSCMELARILNDEHSKDFSIVKDWADIIL